jgi:hypothetical protein
MGALLTIMSPLESCCTCATLLSDTQPVYSDSTSTSNSDVSSPISEKPLLLERRLDCCARVICAQCQSNNPRFKTYCPFCQISSSDGSIPKEGLRLPPSYTKETRAESSLRALLRDDEAPPPYTKAKPAGAQVIVTPDPNDTIHHLSNGDTLASLSLLYNVPLPVLRQHNSFPVSGTSDFLLPARKIVLIPASHYNGPSLSTPPDPEEEEKKNKIRKFMVLTKVVDYGVAGLYLGGSGWSVETAVAEWREDERWERENPLKAKGKEKRRRGFGGGGSLVGQLS